MGEVRKLGPVTDSDILDIMELRPWLTRIMFDLEEQTLDGLQIDADLLQRLHGYPLA